MTFNYYKNVFFNLSVIVIVLIQINIDVYAKSKVDIQYNALPLTEFLDKAYTPTYDCPIPELLTEIERRLETPSLSTNEYLALKSMKTHSLICNGKFAKAKSFLKEILANQDADKSSRYYVSAIYQLGFVFDTEEDDTRCKYYNLAKDASDGIFTDIQLSANLGYISECMAKNINERFFAMLETLDFITKFGDPAAIAHAHNRIGYLYAAVGRTNLAAQQYMKGFNVAQDVYTPSNLLTLLNNAITNFISANQFEEAEKALDTYIEINSNVDILITNLRQQLLLAKFYLNTNDFLNLEKVLSEWAVLDSQTNNYLYNRLFAVYSAHLCIYKNDIQCMADFMEAELYTVPNYQAHVRKDLAYLELLVRINIALDNTDRIQSSFEDYVKKVKDIQKARFDSANSINLLALHSEINQLESKLNDQQKVSSQLSLAVMLALLFGFVLLIFVWNKLRIKNKIYDKLTGLLNAKETYKRLSNLDTPTKQNTNALAVFNFSKIIETKGLEHPDYNTFMVEIANTFRAVCRGNDIVGRLEDEKFVICIANIDESIAESFFERVKSAFVRMSFTGLNINSRFINSCVSIYCSDEKFSDAQEVVNNMLLSLKLQKN